MCRAKPGNRCSTCSTASLRSAQQRHATAAAAYEQQQCDGVFDVAPAKERKARERVTAAEERLVKATLNHDATRPGLKELRAQLEKTKGSRSAAARDETKRLERRLNTATRLRQERKQLSAKYPSGPPATPQASRTRAALGSAYDDLATARARLELHDTPPESATRAVTAAEQRAFQADVQHRFAQAKGSPDPAHLSADEVKAFRSAPGPMKRQLATLSHLRAAAQGEHHSPSLRAEAERSGERVRRNVGLSPGGVPARDPEEFTTATSTADPGSTGAPPRGTPPKKPWLKMPKRSRKGNKDGLSGKVADLLDDQLDVQAGRQQGKFAN